MARRASLSLSDFPTYGGSAGKAGSTRDITWIRVEGWCDADNGESSKVATFYKVVVRTKAGKKWMHLKRYSDFEKLHKKLKGESCLKGFQFPDKINLGKSQYIVKEERLDAFDEMMGLLFYETPREQLYTVINSFLDDERYEVDRLDSSPIKKGTLTIGCTDTSRGSHAELTGKTLVLRNGYPGMALLVLLLPFAALLLPPTTSSIGAWMIGSGTVVASFGVLVTMSRFLDTNFDGALQALAGYHLCSVLPMLLQCMGFDVAAALTGAFLSVVSAIQATRATATRATGTAAASAKASKQTVKPATAAKASGTTPPPIPPPAAITTSTSTTASTTASASAAASTGKRSIKAKMAGLVKKVGGRSKGK
ncbi:unnamed protein product, partial [Chrysoparadoxa australica]